ncbi:MAG: hypothetical protein C4542_06065 [Dehalococcoidia bacterium]|nr:MAG: hypothetical protein C4542_06065 [Dehalococcoidia bacterium]
MTTETAPSTSATNETAQTTGASPAPAAPAAPATDWSAGLDPDTGAYTKNKGWKAPSDIITSYRNLEKVIGADRAGRTVVLPGKDAKPEELEALYNRLGRPASPDKYSISAEGDDGGFTEWARGTFHKSGLTDVQAKSLAGEYQAYAKQVSERRAAEMADKMAAEHESLKKEWGAKYEHNVGVAKRAAAAFGVPPEVLDTLQQAIGFAGVMKFMATVGAKMGEDTFEEGGDKGGGFGLLSPAEAKAELDRLMSDKDFKTAWLDKNHPRHAEMMERKARLVQMASV